MRSATLPLLAAVIVAGLWLALPTGGPPTVGATALVSGPLTPDSVVAALAAEERLLRRTVEAQVRRGERPSTGADPAFLAVGPAGQALAVTRSGDVFVVGDTLQPGSLDGATPSPRLLAWLQQAEAEDDDDDDDARDDSAATVIVGDGSFDVVRLRRLARQVVIERADGARQVVPFIGALHALTADRRDGVLRVFIVGTEDAPLDRSLGTFGTLDPFFFRVDIDEDGVVTRRFALDLGPEGVVTPKAIARLDDHRLVVAGAGSGVVAVVDGERGVIERVVAGLVGAHDVVVTGGRIVLTSPIADAVAVLGPGDDDRRVLPLRDPRHPPASALSRLGEALVFTTALAPEQDSAGIGSRFTCEACHDDGGGDGRLHSSGRFSDDGEVMVSTKPLRGVFQNPPLFSRAFDESVAAMVHAEVGVGNAGSPRGPWTPLVPALDAPFLEDVVGDAFGDVIDPVTQRRAMLHFFTGFAPAPVPSTTMTPTLADWGVFRAHCQRCHAPRVFTDDPASLVDDGRAADLARLRGLVWATEARVDVGVRPLVREGGARVSSLRGIADKRPLLTNGSAPTLEALLRQLRVDGDHIWHDGPGTRGRPLFDDEIDALLRVLRSL
jgi:hypothetical protein